jgi:hypothetical protein
VESWSKIYEKLDNRIKNKEKTAQKCQNGGIWLKRVKSLWEVSQKLVKMVDFGQFM